MDLAADLAAASTLSSVSLVTLVQVWWRVCDAISSRYRFTCCGFVRLLLMGLSKDDFSPEAALKENIPSGGIFILVEEIIKVTAILVCHDLQTMADGSEVE